MREARAEEHLRGAVKNHGSAEEALAVSTRHNVPSFDGLRTECVIERT